MVQKYIAKVLLLDTAGLCNGQYIFLSLTSICLPEPRADFISPDNTGQALNTDCYYRC
jgi:hypothetical protein